MVYSQWHFFFLPAACMLKTPVSFNSLSCDGKTVVVSFNTGPTVGNSIIGGTLFGSGSSVSRRNTQRAAIAESRRQEKHGNCPSGGGSRAVSPGSRHYHPSFPYRRADGSEEHPLAILPEVGRAWAGQLSKSHRALSAKTPLADLLGTFKHAMFTGSCGVQAMEGAKHTGWMRCVGPPKCCTDTPAPPVVGNSVNETRHISMPKNLPVVKSPASRICNIPI